VLTQLLQTRFFQRLWSIIGAVSIRTKVLGIVLGTVILLSTFVTVQVRRSLTALLQDRLERQALSITAHVAESASNVIETGSSETLDLLLQETQAHYSDERHNTQITYLLVIGPDGSVLGSTFADGIPTGLLRANPVKAGASPSLVWRNAGSGRILDVGEQFKLPDGQAGVVWIGLSDREIRTAVNEVTRQLIITSVVMSLLSIAAAVFLTWLITRPIRNLVRATQSVAQGDLSQRVTPWANDEIGRLAVTFNAMTEALRRAAQEQAERAELRAQFVNRVIAAQEDERRRIARELHDSTSQSLTSLLVGLRALEQTGAENSEQRTEDLRKIVSDTLEEVHTLAWQIRPSALDDLGLAAALERYTSDYRERYGLPVDLVIHGLREDRLTPEMETTIYRIVQEALTNVARHAQANQVSVMIERRDGKTLVIVEDNGVGMDPGAAARESQEHLGLFGIRERAELLGGKLLIESESGHGTSLFVEIPDSPAVPVHEP
jgi:signal transduction histidine kinase